MHILYLNICKSQGFLEKTRNVMNNFLVDYKSFYPQVTHKGGVIPMQDQLILSHVSTLSGQ